MCGMVEGEIPTRDLWEVLRLLQAWLPSGHGIPHSSTCCTHAPPAMRPVSNTKPTASFLAFCRVVICNLPVYCWAIWKKFVFVLTAFWSSSSGVEDWASVFPLLSVVIPFPSGQQEGNRCWQPIIWKQGQNLLILPHLQGDHISGEECHLTGRWQQY